MTSFSANYNYPTSYRLGAGRRAELSGALQELAIMVPLIVTDKNVAQLPWFVDLIAELSAQGTRAEVFDGVHPNPIEADVIAAVEQYRASGCDGVVVVGGGSAMDAGKCVALLAAHSFSVFEFEDVGDNWRKADPAKIAKIIAIPTTAGTGSEVGRASVIVNAAHEKKIIFHPQLLPSIVIADPEVTYALPAKLTAYTGIDAFVHCFEAFCSPSFHPMADGIALEGMKLIHENLLIACREPRHEKARTKMLLASSMGATAFQKGLGVIHALSHALGGRLSLHHGFTNAILLPYGMVFNRKEIAGHCERIVRHLDLPKSSSVLADLFPADSQLLAWLKTDPQEHKAFNSLLHWVLELRKKAQVPHSLNKVAGFELQSISGLADVALLDPSMGGNPRGATREELQMIYQIALTG